MRIRDVLVEFAPSGDGGGSGDYFQALASAWYNGTFDSGSLQKGIKSQQDVEQLLQRGIIGPDGVTRKYGIDYNSTFDGVVISSDDYYEHADHDETDSRTGKPFGPYDYMEFGDEELDEGLNEFAADSDSGRWYTDDQMTDLVGDGWWQDMDVSGANIGVPDAEVPKKYMIQQAQRWLKRQGHNVQVLNVKVNDDDCEWYIEGTFPKDLTEFAPDSNDGGGEDDALRNYARMWWAGDEATQMQIEKVLARMGWEIGEDEGGYDNGGVFVVRAGDENGNSYQSWAAEDLTEGVAEATGDEKFDTMMGQIQREPKYPDSQMPPTDVKDLYQWAVKNNKPYHKIFAEWANREGFKSVAPALMKAGDLDTEALDYWTPRVWKIYWGEVRGIDSEMPPEWSKKRVPDELRDYLETVFDAYDRIVFDWPTEYRQIGGQDNYAEGASIVSRKSPLGPTRLTSIRKAYLATKRYIDDELFAQYQPFEDLDNNTQGQVYDLLIQARDGFFHGNAKMALEALRSVNDLCDDLDDNVYAFIKHKTGVDIFNLDSTKDQGVAEGAQHHFIYEGVWDKVKQVFSKPPKYTRPTQKTGESPEDFQARVAAAYSKYQDEKNKYNNSASPARPQQQQSDEPPPQPSDDDYIGHGTAANELRMFIAGQKPAAIVSQHELPNWKNLIDSGKYVIKQLTAHGKPNSVIIAQPGENQRVEQLYKLVQNATDAGDRGDFRAYENSNYHRWVGKLLGYPEDKINAFIEKYFRNRTDLAKKPVYEQSVAKNAGRAVNDKGLTQQRWLQLVQTKFPDAKIVQAKMIDGPCRATLPDGRTLSWVKAEQGMAEDQLDEKSTSQAQFRTMAAAAHDPKFAKKVGIKQSVAREFNQADTGQDYKSLPKKATEGATVTTTPGSIEPGGAVDNFKQQMANNTERDMAEGNRKPEPPEADYGDDYQDMVKRVKKLAGLGPLKTQYDPAKRVYRNMPTAVQPKK